MKRMTWLLAVVMVALMTVVPAVMADGPIKGRAGRSEVRFMEGMIDHHQMALDMGADCLKKATTDALRKVCQNIIDSQSKEIKTMQGWLSAWYQIDYVPMNMSQMMDMMGKSGGPMMGGMHRGGMMHGTPDAGHMGGMMGGAQMPDDMPMMMGMMAGLSKLSGVDYEIAWTEAMIDHHDDAVHMSQRILKNAEHKELRAMAEQIIKDQTSEIETLESLIKTLTK
jgi:uncharacterized protein (DUF305 family)